MSRYTPLELAQAFIKTGEIQDAREALDEHLDAHPDDQEVLRMRAEVLMRFDNEQAWQLAVADYQQLETMTAQDILRYSVLMEKLARMEQAKAVLRQSVERFPDDVRLLERYVHCLQQSGDYAEALKLVGQQPRNWRWLQWQADILREQGNFKQAIVAYTDALSALQAHIAGMDKNWSDSLQARLLLARANCYLRRQDYLHAESDINTAKAFVADEPILDFYRGLIYHAQGNADEALVTLQRALNNASGQVAAEMWQELSAEVDLLQQLKQKFEE